MMDVLYKRLKLAFSLTSDLVENLNEENLKLRLDHLPSNTIGMQLWCMVGARESYLNAIKNKVWVGFSCSLDDAHSLEKVKDTLKKTAMFFSEYLESHGLNEKQVDLLLALLEHEILHHGQLSHYVYGNKLAFPRSWNERYSV